MSANPRAATLMYHDVVRGRAPTLYENDTETFEHHLKAIRDALGARQPALVTDPNLSAEDLPVFITFDDGGESAFHISAPLLESFGWRGHFFIISRYIGQPGYLSADQIRDLAARGHDIGSHSASHAQLGRLSPEQIAEEWRESTTRIAEILGRPVRTAAVPHGEYTTNVGVLAAAAGIEFLFTSTPAIQSFRLDRCTVYGRFSVQRRTTASQAAAFALGDPAALVRQRVMWEVKRLVKNTSRPLYDRTRRLLLARS